MIKEMIEKGEIIIEKNLITIPLRSIDNIMLLNSDTSIPVDFKRELEEYIYTSEYKDCKIIPIYNGGLNEKGEYQFVLLPNIISEKDMFGWFVEKIQKRLLK